MNEAMKKALKSTITAVKSTFPASSALGTMFAVYGNDTAVSEFRSLGKIGLS